MGRNRKELTSIDNVVGQLNFSVFARTLPRNLIEDILVQSGRKELRVRALPAYLVVYYVVAMCVYSQIGVVEVLRWILAQARSFYGFDVVRIATSGAISSARTRLGSNVLEQLYRRVVVPAAVERTRGAWYNGLRLVALDGSTLDLQDTPANAKRFGYSPVGRGDCAFPQMRFVALAEAGTRILFAARCGSFAMSELALANAVVPELKPDMLCLADRLFYSYELWKKATQTGAQLLWRIKTCIRTPLDGKQLPDGSWLTTLYPDEKSRRHKCNGLQARVIEYRLSATGAPAETYRLLTTLTDWNKYPAKELAEQYRQRWEIELAYDEFKTHLRGGRVVLRSKTPELTEQEFYGFLLAHYSAKQLMHEAALANDIEPNRISFKHTIEVIKRHAGALPAAFSPGEDTPIDGNNTA